MRSRGRGFESQPGTRRKNSGQDFHTYVPLSSSIISWYRLKGDDALRLGSKGRYMVRVWVERTPIKRTNSPSVLLFTLFYPVLLGSKRVASEKPTYTNYQFLTPKHNKTYTHEHKRKRKTNIEYTENCERIYDNIREYCKLVNWHNIPLYT